ncbi:MAG: exodeoxyribonuclease VII large subunit [Solirubrobacteraceae bacterium]|nr:exodeoxyribonuclease VII large subunit [Solirubrobacteraceae bacterium]
MTRSREHDGSTPAPAEPEPRPEGLEGSELPGPFPVGTWAKGFQGFLRTRPRVQLFGEVWNLRRSRAKVYFELRDVDGAAPCSIWADRLDALGLPEGSLVDGARVVVAGGPGYYPGSRTASPSFGFDVSALRIAGEGDLLAQLAALRRRLDAEGLFKPQKALPRTTLPRTIGVVTGEGGKARDDVLAALLRRGWGGRLVWAFAPVQDRHAAPAITRALQDLAALEEVDVVIVARGGGSLADLFAFCDEMLCRTVALLRVPVIASLGHHTDSTLLDDVAAVSCSTPTHAATAAVPLDIGEQRRLTAVAGRSLARHGRRAVVERGRALTRLARVPGEHVERQRRALHQELRELRASATRRVAERRRGSAIHAEVLRRKATAAADSGARERRRALDGLTLALDAHEPRRVLERGYAMVDDGAGALVTSAAAARAARSLRVTFADGSVRADVEDAGT